MLIRYVQTGRHEELQTKLLKQVASKSMQSLLMYYRDEMALADRSTEDEAEDQGDGLIQLV